MKSTSTYNAERKPARNRRATLTASDDSREIGNSNHANVASRRGPISLIGEIDGTGRDGTGVDSLQGTRNGIDADDAPRNT